MITLKSLRDDEGIEKTLWMYGNRPIFPPVEDPLVPFDPERPLGDDWDAVASRQDQVRILVHGNHTSAAPSSRAERGVSQPETVGKPQSPGNYYGKTSPTGKDGVKRNITSELQGNGEPCEGVTITKPSFIRSGTRTALKHAFTLSNSVAMAIAPGYSQKKRKTEETPADLTQGLWEEEGESDRDKVYLRVSSLHLMKDRERRINYGLWREKCEKKAETTRRKISASLQQNGCDQVNLDDNGVRMKSELEVIRTGWPQFVQSCPEEDAEEEARRNSRGEGQDPTIPMLDSERPPVDTGDIKLGISPGKASDESNKDRSQVELEPSPGMSRKQQSGSLNQTPPRTGGNGGLPRTPELSGGEEGPVFYENGERVTLEVAYNYDGEHKTAAITKVNVRETSGVSLGISSRNSPTKITEQMTSKYTDPTCFKQRADLPLLRVNVIYESQTPLSAEDQTAAAMDSKPERGAACCGVPGRKAQPSTGPVFPPPTSDEENPFFFLPAETSGRVFALGPCGTHTALPGFAEPANNGGSSASEGEVNSGDERDDEKDYHPASLSLLNANTLVWKDIHGGRRTFRRVIVSNRRNQSTELEEGRGAGFLSAVFGHNTPHSMEDCRVEEAVAREERHQTKPSSPLNAYTMILHPN